jgi:hypothetical protein
MRSKDQILLEDAYEKVLNENLMKTLGTGALAATMGLQGLKANNTDQRYPQDMDGAAIQSIQNPEYSDEGAYEEVKDQLSNLEVGNFTKEPPIDKNLLLKAANIKDKKPSLTDLIQLKGYNVPELFGAYEVLPSYSGG